MIAVVQLVHVRTRLQPMRKKFRRVQKHSNRFMGFKVCQIILSHNNILIGDWQSLLIKSLGQVENSIVSNICEKKMRSDGIFFFSYYMKNESILENCFIC